MVYLTIDNRMTVEEYVMNVIVCNGPLSGAGMRWTRKSKMDDGLLEIVTIRRIHFLKVLWSLPKLYMGKLETLKEVTVYQVKELKVTGDLDLPIECEGEEPGKLPAIFSVIPHRLQVFVP